MERYELPNGLTIVTERLPTFRSVAIGLWVRAGSVNESARNNGISHLLEHLFFKGTTTRSARQLMELVESVGGTSNAFTSREYTCLYAKVLDTHVDLALDLLSDILLRSVYADFDREKAVIEEEIQSYYDTPEDHVHDLFTETLWAGHPLGRSITGTREAVRSIQLDMVRDYYATWYRPGNAVVAVAGNFDPDDLRRRLADAFGPWDGAAVERAYPAPTTRSASVVNERDLNQVHLCLGTQGIPADDPRRYAFNVLSNVLGGSSISRLFQRVREDEGLAYQVGSYCSLLERTGMFEIYSAQAPENTDRVLDICGEELADLRDTPLGEAELRMAKEQLKGNIVLGLESTSNRMMRLARSTLSLGQPEDIDPVIARVEAVTSGDVRDLAAELFQPERMTYTVLGPTEAVPPLDF